MTHMVTYRSGEDQPVYHPTESLEEAARHVEQLRNAGQGGDARIFRMEEIPMEVKTYYKVEVAVGGGKKPDAAPAPAVPVAEDAAPAPAAAPSASAPAEAEAATAPATPTATATAPAATPPSKGEPAAAGANGSGGRFGLFGKG